MEPHLLRAWRHWELVGKLKLIRENKVTFSYLCIWRQRNMAIVASCPIVIYHYCNSMCYIYVYCLTMCSTLEKGLFPRLGCFVFYCKMSNIKWQLKILCLKNWIRDCKLKVWPFEMISIPIILLFEISKTIEFRVLSEPSHIISPLS